MKQHIKLSQISAREQLDKFLREDWPESKGADSFSFDLSEVEWLSAETLTFLFAWINTIRLNGDIKVDVIMPTLDPLKGDNSKSKKRRERRSVSLISKFDIKNNCNLSSNSLYGDTSINRSEFWHKDRNWNSIKPFEVLSLSDFKKFKNIKKNLPEKMDGIYKEINTKKSNVYKLLNEFFTYKPFENKVLSHLVTVELYLNSIQHTNQMRSYFSTVLHNKFTREGIKRKFEEEHNSELSEKDLGNKYKFYTDNILKRNIESSFLSETFNFFREDGDNSKYKNQSFIEFNYIDFGEGIPTTLVDKYEKDILKEAIKKQLNDNHLNSNNKDTKVLEYACLLSSSRNQFSDSLEIQDFVPRGLFFLVDIIRQYSGLLIIQSKSGRIIYDFSNTRLIKDSISHSEMESEFPGTSFQILIPETVSEHNIHPPSIDNFNISGNNKLVKSAYLSVLDMLNKVSNDSEEQIEIYNGLFNELNSTLEKYNSEPHLIYLDFAAVELSYINQKIFYYLCNTPKINSNTSLIVLNVKDSELISAVRKGLSEEKPFIFRPIPFLLNEGETKRIEWIGVQNEVLVEKLNRLINSKEDSIELKKYEADNWQNLNGNFIKVTWFEEDQDFGLIHKETQLPTTNNIIFNNCIYAGVQLARSIDKPRKGQPKILLKGKDKLFHTSGGYYQNEFLRFYDLLFLSNQEGLKYAYRIAIDLFNKWMFDRGTLPKIDFVLSVTLSGQILGKEILKRYEELKPMSVNDNNKPKLIKLAHYYEFETEFGFKKIKEGSNVLIVTDVISTGSLIQSLHNSIDKKGGKVSGVFTIVDSREENNNLKAQIKSIYNNEIDQRIVSLTNYPIKKFDSSYINLDANRDKKVLRINPILNVPVTMDEEDSVLNISVLLPNLFEELKALDSEDILIGYFKNNNAYHSYFFNTSSIFNKKSGIQFLRKIIDNYKSKTKVQIDCIFTPMLSSIELVSENDIREILKNRDLELYTIPRIDTPQGWRFTFPPKILNEKTKGKNVLILDDGSCSGNTLIQMIDMVSYLEVNSIDVISIFCRIDDYQREFFARLKSVRTKKFRLENEPNLTNTRDRLQESPMNIYFGVQAFVPHFPFEKSGRFLEEVKTINELLKYSIPSSLKTYLREREKEISIIDLQLVEQEEFGSRPNYFPSTVDNNDILRIRNDIGKLESYRIYKQHFDNLKSYNESEIELIIGIVIHEPRLNTVLSHLLKDIYIPLVDKVKKTILVDLNKIGLFHDWDTVHLLQFLIIADENIFFSKKLIVNLINSVNRIENQNNSKYFSVILYLWSCHLFEVIPNAKKLLTLNLIIDILKDLRDGNLGELKESSFNLELANLYQSSFEIELGSDELISCFNSLTRFFVREDVKPNHAELSNNITNLADCFLDITNDYEFYPKLKLIDEYFVEFVRTIEESLKPNLNTIKGYTNNYCHTLYHLVFGEDGFEPSLINIKNAIQDYLNNKQPDKKYASQIQVELEDFQSKFLIGNSDLKLAFSEQFPCSFMEVWYEALKSYLNKDLWENSNIKIVDNELPKILIHEQVLKLVFKELTNNLNQYYESEIMSSISFTYSYFVIESNFLQIKIEEDIKPQKNKVPGAGFSKIRSMIEPFDGTFLNSLEEESNFTFSFRFRIN